MLYLELDSTISPPRICFSGLRRHGGFPPTAPPGIEPERWSYRATIVGYPPSAMLDANARISFSTFPDGKLMTLPPEIVKPRCAAFFLHKVLRFLNPIVLSYDNYVLSTNATNWLAEGPYLMSRAAFLKYFSRSIVQFLYHQARQVPEELGLRIDYDAIMQSISLLSDDTPPVPIHPEPWDLRPGSDQYSAKFKTTRAASTSLWKEFKHSRSKYIPFMAHRSK